MSTEASGGWDSSQHRARLFPLPLFDVHSRSAAPSLSVCQPPVSPHSARVRSRCKQQRFKLAVTNRCITALNTLYSPPTPVTSRTPRVYSTTPNPMPPASSSTLQSPTPPPVLQPDNNSSAAAVPRPTLSAPSTRDNSRVRGGSSRARPASTSPCSIDPSKRPSPSGPSASRSQSRLLLQLQQQCAAFAFGVRASSLTAAGSDGEVSATLDALSSFAFVPDLASERRSGPPDPTHPSLSEAAADPTSSLPLPPCLPSTAPFSSASTTVVPLLAERIALPSSLHIVPLTSVLPPDIAARYADAQQSAALFRTPEQVQKMDARKPLRPPRIAGSRSEYVKLIARMQVAGMVSFTDRPLAVNGLFAVAKDAESDRLIIDAQPANRLFVDSPHVALPNPSHLVQLQVPVGATMYVGKSDLSNFYHHLGLPQWMQPYFALPALLPQELASIGVDLSRPFPMCVTLPMGFSHAVFLANTSHEHVLYSSGALDRNDNLLCLSQPLLSTTAVVHGIVIDDFFTFSLDCGLAQQLFQRVLAAYAQAGFIVKSSKVVLPTSATVKVIGFDIGGPHCLVRLPSDSMWDLLHATVAVLRRGLCTGPGLAHIIGRWTWCMLLRRPSLAVLQRSYHYIEVAGPRRFTLWPSVRHELWMLIGLAPLLHARLDVLVHPRVIASDASELAAGVVAGALTADLHRSLWPLCSSKTHAVLQPLMLRAQQDGADAALPSSDSLSATQQSALELMRLAGDVYTSLYEDIKATHWSRIISTPWRSEEHINVLELRAALLAMHWLLSFPSAHSRRVYLLVDSTVALFSLWKGRSSSPALLLVLRKISALLLASGVALLPGWLPTAVNPADDASRLRGHTEGEKEGVHDRGPGPPPPPLLQ